MKVHEYTRIENKLDLKTRNAGDRLSWFEHDGIVVVRTKRSHGNKDLPQHLICQQLKLNENQFSDLISCSLTKEGYVEILTAKGVIVPRKMGYGVECKNSRCDNVLILGDDKTRPNTIADAIAFVRISAGKLTCPKCGETHYYHLSSRRGPRIPARLVRRLLSSILA